MRNEFIGFTILSAIVLTVLGLYTSTTVFFIVAIILIPILILGWWDMFQAKHTIMRNFPILGRLRYVMEDLRPKIYQYFVESDLNGRPFNRISRSVVYQRAKKETDTSPFGTQMDVNEEGYEWVNHSIAAKDAHSLNGNPRVVIGGKDCKQPYSCSIFNVSAMSFGSLSSNAIMALNGGAKIGSFAHNTGEGGLSPYHTKMGGDLIWQIGTGYFGARTKDGKFSGELFKENAAHASVKMIELKLSQGAKPGHGGILPAKKNTPEIAKIRNVEPGEAVLSPPFHSAFSTPIEMLEFIQQLRTLSGGKPVGFKLCLGLKSEFIGICQAMVKTGIKPDFITVDGGEGGTGAAPIEFANSVGTPIREGLAFVYDTLVGYGLKSEVMILASGKIVTGFDIFKAVALGADACYSARAMMLALGCIQALECNRNSCPTGIATQKKELVKGLVVKDKKVRIANFHGETVKAFVELLAASGLERAEQIERHHVNRRINFHEIQSYDEFYPTLEAGQLLQPPYPEFYVRHIAKASAERF
jgi:glutamate synthase domain-containing protein 2